MKFESWNKVELKFEGENFDTKLHVTLEIKDEERGGSSRGEVDMLLGDCAKHIIESLKHTKVFQHWREIE